MNNCILCKSSKKDDLKYGEFLKSQHFGVHTFCLYMTSNLPQNGKDSEGLLGFMETDIKKEVKRISSLKCFYCRKGYANIGCCERKCRRTFHLICGIENDAQNQFSHDFRSFCHTHVKKYSQRPSCDETCLICYEHLCEGKQKFKCVNMIFTPCCQNGWFHKVCLQKFAKASGYFFKCPLCNDADTFREKLPSRGIFIPNQDAAWEMEPDAFAELLERPSECAAQRCKNKKGRQATSSNNEFIMCNTCGSTAMHRKCLPDGKNRFHCDDCKVAIEEGDSGRESMYSHVNHDDEWIDVCHVSDKEDMDIINRLYNTNTQMKEHDPDVGSHHKVIVISDKEMPQTSRNFYKNIKRMERSREMSDTDCDDFTKPIAAKSYMRLRTDSEGSMSNKTTDRERSDDTLHVENSFKFKRNVNKRRLKSDSDSRSDNEEPIGLKSVKRKSKNALDDDSDSKNLGASDLIGCGSSNSKTTKSESSNKIIQPLSPAKEAFLNSSRKTTCANVLADSKDVQSLSNSEILYNQTCKNEKNNGNECISSIEISESDDDDDPLEHFVKLVKIKNDLRNKTNTDKDKGMYKGVMSEREINQEKKVICKKRTESKFLALNSAKDSTEKENNLDISCIAKRTRRKTICNNRDYVQNKNDKKGNYFNISCIAARTRRKTICAETDYEKESIYEMSQTYEKMYESDEECVDLTDDKDSEFESKSNADSDSFIVDDEYGKNESNFEISCIANRTRKRKSLSSEVIKLQKNDKIYKKPDLCKITIRRRCNRRLSSYSSEECETSNLTTHNSTSPLSNIKTKSIPSTLSRDNITSYNQNAFLSHNYTTKSTCSKPINNYHHSNYCHNQNLRFI